MWPRLSQAIGLFVLIFSLGSAAQSQEKLSCPPVNDSEVSGEDLKNWRESLVKDVLNKKHKQVLQQLDACFSNSLPSCLADLAEFAQTLSNSDWQPQYPTCDNSILSSVNDLPPELIEEVKGEKFIRFPANLEALAKAKGWKTALYKTRSSGGFDGSQLLYLLVIPGTKENGMKEHYLQISPPSGVNRPQDDPTAVARDNNPHIGLKTLTIISVDRSQKPPVGQLKRMYKEQSANLYSWSSQLESFGCIKCHTVPLRAISPVGFGQLNPPEIAMSKEEQDNIRAINEMMNIPDLSWGKCVSNNRVWSMGPSLHRAPTGWAPKGSPTRKKDFIENCVSTTRKNLNFRSEMGYFKTFSLSQDFEKKVDRDRIVKAMNCIECHDNSKRGYLHADFSTQEITFKVLVDRSMPLGFDNMSIDERMVLLNCLQEEKKELTEKGTWTNSGEWMKRRFCEDFQLQAAKTPQKQGSAK